MTKLKTFPGSTETCSDQEEELVEKFLFFIFYTYITLCLNSIALLCQFTFNTLTE